jgi:DNA-binding response OmpR family regulator
MRRNVLIVEDEPLVAFDMEETVREAGYEVVGPAQDARSALQLIDDHLIDVAILDANLRGWSAAPVAERLRERGVPFVAVSGYSADQLGAWLNGSPLLGKPYAAERLIAVIKELRSGLRE